MSDELIMDTSEKIFKLDKDILDFIINQSSINNLSSLPSANKKPISEVELIVTNLTSEYIVVRIKSTKKEKFAVNPTYSILQPNSEQKIRIIYYHKIGHQLNPEKYKFKIEGFIIPENQKNLDIKNIFNDYIQKKIKVKGNIIKIHSKFTEEININNNLDIIKEDEKDILRESINSTNSLLKSQQTDISILSKYSVPESIKEENEDKTNNKDNNLIKLSDLIINNNNNDDIKLNDEKKLENLKKEYNQIKEELDKLKKNEDLLNRKIKNEKNKKNIIPESEKFRFNVPVIKEKPFSRNILIAIFVFSALIGFYLIK